MRAIAKLAILLLAVLPVPLAAGGEDPLVVVYAHGAPGYARALADLIRSDSRIPAEVLSTDSPEVFRTVLYFPNLKVAVVSMSVERDMELGEGLEWFFSQGGGLVGLGLVSSEASIGNASRTVFPTFGTGYLSGRMNRATRKMSLIHVRAADDEISDGVPGFTAIDHKLMLSQNRSTRDFLPRTPDAGDYMVLFRESSSGAPSIIKYENGGVSVTFASFGGDDYERGFNFYGDYIRSGEFRTLFTNAVAWVWTSESKYERSMEEAASYYSDRAKGKDDVLEEAERLEGRARMNRALRITVTFVLAGVACVVIYRATFANSRE